jgi:ribosome recycling factor
MVQLVLIENNHKDFEKAMDVEMTKVVKHFEKELIGIRTGRAHTSLIEDIPVSVYGANPAPLKHLAVLTAADARMLTVQPWDVATIGDIEKAIATVAGLTAQNDGKLIRIQLPEMSTSRRDELVKVLHKKLEDCRVGIRNVRKDFQNLVRDTEKNKKISKDFATRLTDLLQKFTDKYIESAESMSEKKEKDIKTV